MSTFQQWQADEANKAKKESELKQDKPAGRIEAFSDAVFAIAIALLVLEIKVPQPWSHRPLIESLEGLYPSYLGYVVSFLTLLVMWLNHHRLFKLVRRADDWLPFANGVLLLFVAFIPFPTAVMAENWSTPDRKTGVLFYAGAFILLALAFQVLWFCISHKNRLVDDELDHQKITAITRQYLVGPGMYLFSFIVGFWSPEACLAMNLVWAMFFAIPGLSFGKSEVVK
jgi:uncharacterized membrane protein